MTLLSIATSVMITGAGIYLYGIYRGFRNWDDWAWSMMIRNAGFITMIVSVTLFIVWWVQP